MSTNPSPAPSRPSWVQLVVVALCVVVVDQITKFEAVKHLTYAFDHAHTATLGDEVRAFLHARHLTGEVKPPYFAEVIPHFWSNRYAENPGAAWSLLASQPESIRVPFFHVVSLLAIGLIAVYYSRLRSDQKLLGMALCLVMGGAVGNLIDRVIRGYVIDFIDWHLNDPDWHTRWHWPTFNVADTGISIGVGLIALDTLLVWWESRKTQGAPASADV